MFIKELMNKYLKALEEIETYHIEREKYKKVLTFNPQKEDENWWAYHSRMSEIMEEPTLRYGVRRDVTRMRMLITREMRDIDKQFND